MGRSRPAAALGLIGLLGACDVFHSTVWRTKCDVEPAACDAQATVGGAGGASGVGGDSGAAAVGGTGPSSSASSGGGAPCGSSVEDCSTSVDDDCDGMANAGCDLVLYLAFDEGSGAMMVDSSGNDHHGTHDAAYVPGKKGTALAFDGTTGGVVPGAPTLTWGAGNADFTVVYWLRITAPVSGEWRSLLHKGSTDCGDGDRTSAMFLAPTEQRIHSALSTTFVDPMGLCNQQVVNTTLLAPDVWMHVASVKEGPSHRMYIDAALNVSGRVQAVVSNEAPFYVGKDPWYGGTVGEVDELQVYDRALSENEIALLAN